MADSTHIRALAVLANAPDLQPILEVVVRALALAVLAGCGFQAHSPAGIGPDGSITGGEGASLIDAAGSDAAGNSIHRIDVVGTVTGGPHIDFPVLVATTKDWLRTTANGGSVTSDTGADIAFYGDAAATQVLPVEIERYVPTTGELVAWVKLSQLATASTFYIAAGGTTSPGSVWTNSFAGVWHLSNLGESTGTNETSEAGTTATSDTAAAIADGRTFNSSMLAAGNATQVTDVFAAGGTVEAWVYVTGAGGGGFGRIFDKGPSYTLLATCDTSVSHALLFGRTFTGYPGDWCSPANSLPTNTWTHVAATFDDRSSSNVPTIYINGQVQLVTATDTPSGTAYSDGGGNLTIGDRSTGNRAFAGSLDELRLIRTVRSAGWIATEYANQSAPQTFLQVN